MVDFTLNIISHLLGSTSTFLRNNWSLLLVLIGFLVLLGALFRWKWICDPQQEDPDSWKGKTYRAVGEKGYRVVMGGLGLVMLSGGVACWILL